MSQKETYRTAEGVHVRRFGDELVMLDLTSGVYFSLNEVGAFIWESLCAGAATVDVPLSIAERFEVSLETACEETLKLVNDLLEAGLIKRTTPVASGNTIDPR
jgi:hypothetical protein